MADAKRTDDGLASSTAQDAALGSPGAAAERDSKSVVNSVLRACHLMELVASEGSDVSLSKLAERSGLTRPTTHRLLSTLEMAGWVRRTQPGKYGLTMKLFIVGSSASGSAAVRDLAGPVLATLAAKTGDTSYLFVPNAGRALCLDRVEGPYPVRVHHINVGDLIAMTTGAAPLAILAYRPDLVAALTLDRRERASLADRLVAAHTRGYVRSPDDLFPGITAIGAPVFDRAGSAVAGVSVAGVSARFDDSHEAETVEHVMAASRELSILLGHQPESDAV